ncbi:hypothetical protein ANN_27057 [Periplaneta americana]|uniref:Uncharacterized protein n=1 Tax=Periplaneta americana TaxID=6978 RepID=A0ABQ8RX88_PERAM|nr:hypothetical protein ANN_27057 [Periplaneta americana]
MLTVEESRKVSFVCLTNRHPTPSEEDAPQGVVWPSAGAYQDQVAHYVLGHQESPVEPVDGIMPLRISVVPDLFKARMDFWDSLPLNENQ